MNDTKRMMRIVGTTLAAAIFLGSCSIGLTPDTAGPEEDLERLDAELNLTANSAVEAAEAQLAAADESDDSVEIGALTTYNNPGMDPVVVVGADPKTVDLPARSDYPYPGWTTTGTVEHIADPDALSEERGWDNTVNGTNYLFKVTAIASPDQRGVYPESEVREVYYVESSDGDYSPNNDGIFNPYQFSGERFREEYVAEYEDGSSRAHFLMANASGYEAFDISESLDIDVWTSIRSAKTDSDALFGSATMYTHELGSTFNYWFWNNSEDVTPYIVGWRYYTEHLVDDEYVGTSLSFEYTYDNSWRYGDGTPQILARTIIREEMRFAHDDLNGDGEFQSGEVGAATDHQLRLRTEINNTSGGEGLIYTRQGKNLTHWNSRGNARNAQLRGVQRNSLPQGYSDFADFEAVIDEVTEGTQ